ncbi:MAG: isochorismatase family protein [Actinomycetota bacterium]
MAEYDRGDALLVVDVQNDFADPGGSLFVRGGEEILPVVNREVQTALAAGSTVVFTQDWHPERTPHFQTDGGIWPVHCVRETWGAEFHPALHRPPEAAVLRKGVDGEDGYSGFSVRDPGTGEVEATGLESLLRDGGIERVLVAGLATDYCVKETVLDARRLGFKTVVLLGAVRAVDLQPGDGDRAIDRMREAGAEIE